MEKLPDILPVNDSTGVLRAAYGAPLTAAEMDARIFADEAEADFSTSISIPNHWIEALKKKASGGLLADENEDFPALPPIFKRLSSAQIVRETIAIPTVAASRGATSADVLAPFYALVKETLENERSADEPEFVHPLEASKLAKRTEPDVEAAALEAAVWRTEQGTNETEGEFLARCATIAKGIVA